MPGATSMRVGTPALSRRRPQRRGEAARLEQRRVDPVRELPVSSSACCTSRPISSRSAFAAAGSSSASLRASWRLTASAIRCCCGPSWRSRSIARRSASAARTSRSRDARSSSTSRRSRSSDSCGVSACESSRVIDLPSRTARSCPSSERRRQEVQHPRTAGWLPPGELACRHRSPGGCGLLASSSPDGIRKGGGEVHDPRPPPEVSRRSDTMKKPRFIAISLLVAVALALGGAATSSANPPPQAHLTPMSPPGTQSALRPSARLP